MINLLDQVVAEVFALMLGHACEPQPGTPATGEGYIALVTFSGSFEGECTLHLGRETAETLTRELLGEDDESLWPDTVGELCNMIAGTWKSRLSGEQAACTLSVPQVTEGAISHASSHFPATVQRPYRAGSINLTLALSLA